MAMKFRRVARGSGSRSRSRSAGSSSAARPRGVEMLEGRTLYNATYFSLAGGDFSQDWNSSDTLMTTANDWSNVPSIVGFRGDGLTNSTATDPQTTTAESTVVNLLVNSTATSTTGGIHEIANNAVALQGSGTADSPYLQLHLNTTGRTNVRISYNLKELDNDNADQKFALQYRIGTTGAFTNVPAGAISGFFNAAGQQTKNFTDIVLPAAVDNQSQVQVRIMTNDAPGSDSMVGIDDIVVKSDPLAGQTLGFDASTASVGEGAGTLQLRVARGGATTGTLTVDYNTSDITAHAGSDYTATSGTLTFNPGDTEKFIPIPITDDASAEPAETFKVTLSNAVGASLGTAEATVTIADNDGVTGGKPLASGPLMQNWSDTNMITTDDDWSGVPYFVGYRGDGLTAGTGTNPETILADGTDTPVDVNANKDFLYLGLQGAAAAGTGGLAEIDQIADPAVTINGSGTAKAPFLLFSVDTTGVNSVDVSYNLRDLDWSSDDAVQQVALQYRIGNSGTWTNVDQAYVADATLGGSDTLVTPVAVTLTGAIANQPLVQFRIMTTDAVGNDEFVGIDDIVVQQTPVAPGAFAFESATTNVSESAGTLPVRVVRTGGSSGPATVDYTTTAGTAGAGDFTTTSGTLSFTDGQTDNFIFIPITNDSTAEVDENFTVTLSNPTGGTTLGAVTTNTVTINDDDVVKLSSGPLTQDWSDTSLISVNDNWGGVLGIRGYRGDGLTGATGTDPTTITAFAGSGGPVLDVNANVADPNSFTTGGVAEFDALGNPTVGLAGSGTAKAPFLLFEVDTTGINSVDVSYTLRDLESGADDAAQQVALQYRVGNTGDFVNVPDSYVADATVGGANGPDVPQSFTINDPAIANQPLVQFRVMTTDALGNDEWVGVDDIVIKQTPTAGLPAWVTGSATWNGATLTVTGAATIVADPQASGDNPSIVADGAAAALTINPTSDRIIHVAGLALSNGATATVTSIGAGTSATNQRVLVIGAGGISVTGGTGGLDLNDNGMIVTGTSLAAVQSLVGTGYSTGHWNGVGGIDSAQAAADPIGVHTLGVASAAVLNPGGGGSFDGVTLAGNEILVKYTVYGDHDLNGRTTLDDFSLFLNGYQTGGHDWVAGDSDFNGHVNLDDFSLFLYGYQHQQ